MKNSPDLSKYAAIFEGLKASDLMVANVVVVSPERKIAFAKEMMKIKKISGMPVVDDQRRLTGIISIEDIINALEFHRMNEPVRSVMTQSAISVQIDEPIAGVVDKFDNFKFGRFPVVDGEGKVRGIITRKDILHGILEKFNLLYIHDNKRNTILNSEYSAITGERLLTHEVIFRYQIDTADINSAGIGASLLKKFLLGKNFDAEICRRIAVATYESETNVVIHSKGHGDIYCYIEPDHIIVRVVDNGVGIEDLDRAMRGGYSTAPDYVREFGFGAGMGIANMKRFSDKMVILSERNAGTQVEMIFYLPAVSSEATA